MGMRHRELAVEGVQFHPESIMTPAGKDLLRELPGGSHHDSRSDFGGSGDIGT